MTPNRLVIDSFEICVPDGLRVRIRAGHLWDQFCTQRVLIAIPIARSWRVTWRRWWQWGRRRKRQNISVEVSYTIARCKVDPTPPPAPDVGSKRGHNDGHASRRGHAFPDAHLGIGTLKSRVSTCFDAHTAVVAVAIGAQLHRVSDECLCRRVED